MKEKSESAFFKFEQDFVEAGIRCIPMVVRFKLDACGIKLKLAAWNRMTGAERAHLVGSSCQFPDEVQRYREYLCDRIVAHTGEEPTPIPVPATPPWSRLDKIPESIAEKLQRVPCSVSIAQWAELSDLQRFALVKLSYDSHEHKNFPKALKEFGLWRGE